MSKASRIWQIDLDVDADGAFAIFYRNNRTSKRFGISPDNSMEKKLRFLKRVQVAQQILLEGIDLTGNRKK